MKHIKQALAAIAMSCCLSSLAHAANIEKLLIGEIGLLSGGLGTSAEQPGGGYFSANAPFGPLGGASFVSQGSVDGALLMGTVQGVGDFSSGFLWQGQTAYPTTLNGAPSGNISNGIMTLDMSGFTGEWDGISFSAAPDPGTMTTAVSLIGNGVYFFTADWSHLVTANDAVPDFFHGMTFDLHLEGIAVTRLAAPVPEAETYAMLLAGLGLVGFAAHRRRKRL
ncbi:MAG: PEP-CTERM sorting domain-containing protein [Pseudomonadota bacterium]